MVRGKLNFAMGVLAVPFLVRASYILIRKIADMDRRLIDSIRHDTALAPVITFLVILISDLVPITSQLVSMLVVVDNRGYNDVTQNAGYQERTESEDSYYKSILAAQDRDEESRGIFDPRPQDSAKINASRQ